MLNSKNKKKFISGIILFLFVFNLTGIGIAYPKRVEAIPVEDIGHMTMTVFQTVKDALKTAWEKVEKAAEWADKARKETSDHIAAVAFKATLHSFLKTLAIDTATWVATGDKGQKPMFITQGWGAYLTAAADRAAGEFIMTATSEWDNRQKYGDEMHMYYNCMEEAYEMSEKCVSICVSGNVKGKLDAKEYEECMKDCDNRYTKPEEDAIKACNKQYSKYLQGASIGTTGRSYSSGMAGNITRFLCEPDLRVKLRISAGLADIERPKTPRCTFSKAKRNWDTFVNDPDFLSRFQSYWDPWENDVGRALTMHSSFLENRKWGIKTAEKARDEGEGWKALKDVAGKILTPSTLIHKMGAKPIEEGTSPAKIWTGDIIADAVGTFADTLMGKLLDKWVSKGLVGSGSDSNDYNWIKGNFSGSSSATMEKERLDKTKAAKEKFSKVFKPDLQAGKPYSILKKLSLCSDNNNPGPTDCVITQDFITAISQKLTVQEAINQGHINPEAPFGFIANGLEPSYNEGYSYRSLIILRKYRIIPVGWELAAEYIGNILSKTGETKKVFNIQELISAFDDSTSPFYKLIDPNWVLKAPELYCAKQGYGEKIISSQITDGIDMNNDNDYDDENEQAPRIAVLRDEYCADEQSCIKEDDEGKCLFYGYCTEENRRWNFQGESCEPYYNSCQIFQSPEGKEVSYIKKSLDFNGCNADNAGCEWHCASRDFIGDDWICSAPGVDFDSSTSTPGVLCNTEEGCELYDSNDFDQDGDTSESCTVPYNGIGCRLDDSKARIVMNPSAVVPRANNDLYFDRDVEECDKGGEGCHEYIRTKPNLGTNLIINPSFEGINNDNFTDWVVVNGILSSESFKGETAFEAEFDGASLNKVVDVGYTVASRKFIFSFYAKGCNAGTFQIVSGTETVDFEESDYWRRFSTAHSFPTVLPAYEETVSLQIINMNDGCIIDTVQLEEVIGSENEPSDYKGYGSSNLLYLKKAPEYYQCQNYTVLHSFITDKFLCESNGHLWRDDIEACVKGGSVKCANFIFECNEDDVGCDLYTPENGDPDIPAVVNSNDFCPEECNGYDTYKQEATFFEISKFPQFIIPENEKTCSARFAGCSEFTNLDKLEQGGEAIEYYTYLRPCQEVDNNCATFYTWVGSEISGFQLKAHLLLDVDTNQEPDSIYGNPAISISLFGICANYGDAISNPECYEFYSEGGIISYHHYKDTKVCSDGCQPYRKTKSTWQDCVDSWGIWNINEECVYEALSEKSIKCPKSQNNCYEYKGNTSNNIRKVIDDGFEEAVNNWGAGMLSSESLIRGGHSLQIEADTSDISYPLKERCVLAADCAEDDGCLCSDGNGTLCYVQNGEQSCIYKSLLRSENTYLLSFWAKGNGNLTVKFSSAPAGDEFADADIALSSEWLQYSLGPVFINWDMDADDPALSAGTQILERLEILGFGDTSYIDNIILKEVRDDLFLIRPDLWNIPLICNQNYNGNMAPQYMLGCKEYKSKIDKETVYLKSFDHLCGSDVVGCEALIDTFNSDNPLQEIFNNGDLSEIIVQADRTTFLVNSRDKNCKAQDKGCIAVGTPNYRYNQHKTYNTPDIPSPNLGDDTDDLYNYKTNYYINDPDEYGEILCRSTELKCNEFDSESGYYYFKDPASQREGAALCEYKSAQGGSDEGWYIKGTDEGNPNCPLLVSDLGVNYAGGSCIGGTDNGVSCPIESQCPGGYCFNWTGECPKKKDGCIEYIDPLSKISQNIVFNNNFLQDVNSDSIPDGWEFFGGYYILDEPLYLKHNTLYTILGESDNPGIKTIILRNCNGNITSPDNSIDIALGMAQISFSGMGQFSGRFYTGSATECTLEVTTTLKPGLVHISKTGVYYNIDKTIDKEGCNGEVDYETGCVLFNERKVQNNGDFSKLVYDADANANTPQPCITSATANYQPEDWTTINGSGIYFNFWYVLDSQYLYIFDMFLGKWISKTELSDLSEMENSPQNWNIITASGILSDENAPQESSYWYVLDGTHYYILDFNSGEWTNGNTADLSGGAANAPANWNNIIASGMYQEGIALFWYLFDSSGNYYFYVDDDTTDEDVGAWSSGSSISHFGNSSNAPSNWVAINASGIYNYKGARILYVIDDTFLYMYDLINAQWLDSALLADFNATLSPTYGCDSNLLVKTKPDRDCGEWLACRDIVEYDQDGEKKKFCLNIGLCDSVSEQGECNNFVLNKKENQTVGEHLDLDSIRDKSGFVQIGEAWSLGQIDGLYPFEKMKQIGNTTSVLNGDFEVYDSRKYPFGWSLTNHMKTWDKSYFKIIGDPLEAQKEGISYPFEGKAFLKFSPSASEIESNFIDVEPGGEYVLSFYVNTKNYHPADTFDSPAAGIIIITYDAAGERSISPRAGDFGILGENSSDILECSNVPLADALGSGQPDWVYWDNSAPPDPDFNGCGAYTHAGKDWTKNILRFRVGENTHRIKLLILGAVWWGGNQICNDTSCSASAACSTEPGTEVRDLCCDIPSGTGEYSNCCPNGPLDVKVVPDNMCSGNVYFDDIKIAPVLNIRMGQHGWYYNTATADKRLNVEQTCRAYPKSDSLSCNYVDDAGIRNIGRYGYCLKYDHFPGNPKQCLIWWPVDLVLGEGIEEGGAYSGRYPLYYSIGNSILIIGYPPSYDSQYGDTNLFWVNQSMHHDLSNTFEVGYLFNTRPVLPRKNYEVVNATGRCTRAYIQSQDSDRLVIRMFDPSDHESDYSFELFDADINEIVFTWSGRVDHTLDIVFTSVHHFTDRIAQVVTPMGQNKYWSGRTYEGSNYITLNPFENLEHYNYNDDYPPFGSIVPPDPDYEPYLWDSEEAIIGFQPLYYDDFDKSLSLSNQPRAGQIQTKKSIKRLFAQSYGVWEWSDNLCQGGINSGNACIDYCVNKGIGICEDTNFDGIRDTCSQQAPFLRTCSIFSNPSIPYDSTVAAGCPTSAPPGFLVVNPEEECLSCEFISTLSIIRQGTFGFATNDLILMSQADKFWGWMGDYPNVNYWISFGNYLGSSVLCDIDNTGPCSELDSWGFDSVTFIPAGAMPHLGGGDGSAQARIMITVVDTYWLLADGVMGGWTNNDGYNINDILGLNCDNQECIYVTEGLTYLQTGEFNMLGNSALPRIFLTNGNRYYILASDNSVVTGSLTDIWPDDPSYPSDRVDSLLNVWAGNGNPAVFAITKGDSIWAWDENDVWGVFSNSCEDFCPNGSCIKLDDARYLSAKGLDWLPPENSCHGNPPTRPIYDLLTKQCNSGDCTACPGITCDFCGIPPKIENIKVNNLNTNIYINNNQTVNLTFNTKIDSQQLPLTMYKIDWGDGTDRELSLTLGSGLKMRDKVDPETPHSFYHLYNYWDMLGKVDGTTSMECGPRGASLFRGNIHCENSPCCAAEIKIQVKDNWGWCNNGASRNECDIPDLFSGYIIVSQFGSSRSKSGTMARVVIEDSIAWGNSIITNNIYVGSAANIYNSGEWFPIHQNGNYIIDGDISSYQNVDGLAIQRMNGSIRAVLYNDFTVPGDIRFLSGYIEFVGSTGVVAIEHLRNDNALSNGLEGDIVIGGYNDSDGTKDHTTVDDEVWMDNGLSYFWLAVSTSNDGYYTDYK